MFSYQFLKQICVSEFSGDAEYHKALLGDLFYSFGGDEWASGSS